MTKKKEHYVNNKEFLEALVVYRKKVNEAKNAGDLIQKFQTILVNVF